MMVQSAAAALPSARAQAALTHPATLIALAALLANDLVFKWIWPGSWWTGKLSDLAWVIFVLPLVALPLTFLTQHNQTARKAAWAIAYVGLPLLYAAYNTFEPLHDGVMVFFSVLRGTPGSSPFDPTDSIVIPLGMAIAIWVWQTAEVNNTSTRAKWSLFVAVTASVASVASTVVAPNGASLLGEDQNGDLVASGRDSWGVFRNLDGGLTWFKPLGDQTEFSSIEWDAQTAVAPDGIYSLEGPNVVRAGDGVIYSTLIVNNEADYRIFALAKDSAVTHLPTDIHYHAKTGNLIVAMGLQGVLVRTPDQNWQRVAVGQYTPIDFSIINRARLVMESDELLYSAIALVFASIAFALTLSTVPVEISGRRYAFASLTATLGIVVGVPFAGIVLRFGLFGADWLFGDFSVSDALFIAFALMQGFFGIAAIVAVIVATGRAFQVSSAVVNSSVIALFLFGGSILPLIYYSELDTPFGEEKILPTIGAIAITVVSIGLIIVKLIRLHSWRGVIAVFVTIPAMLFVFILVFLMWTSGQINLLSAKVASIALIWCIATLLYTHTRNIWQNRPKPPIDPPVGNGDANPRAVYPVPLSQNEHHNP